MPQHRVRITRPFFLGVHEVTQGQYRVVTGQNPSHFKGSDDLPVESVSWYEAVEFCNKLSARGGLDAIYSLDGQRLRSRLGRHGVPAADGGGVGVRLPGGERDAIRFGDDAASLGEYAWYKATPVTGPIRWARSGPTPWACMTCTATSSSGAGTGTRPVTTRSRPAPIPLGPSQAPNRVIRGGDWGHGPTAAGRRTGARPRPVSGSSAGASAWPEFSRVDESGGSRARSGRWGMRPSDASAPTGESRRQSG